MYDQTRLGERRAFDQGATCFHEKWSLPLIQSLHFSKSVEQDTPRMSDDLNAIDTESLKARLSELRRYL